MSRSIRLVDELELWFQEKLKCFMRSLTSISMQQTTRYGKKEDEDDTGHSSVLCQFDYANWRCVLRGRVLVSNTRKDAYPAVVEASSVT